MDSAAQKEKTLDRLARAYESDPEKRRDLRQEIHFALWRSFATFDNRCSLRTWVYRVAPPDNNTPARENPPGKGAEPGKKS